MITTGRIPAIIFAGWCLFAAGCGEKIVATPSGLKYADLVVGKGTEAKAGDYIEAHSIGWLQADETRFENTHEAKAPILVRLGTNERMKGWEEGIVGMMPGGKRKLYVPPALGFRPNETSLLRPANAELVFEVELLRVMDGFKTEDVKVGVGPEAKRMDWIEISYTGELKDGSKKFDSKRDPGVLQDIFQIGGQSPQVIRVPRGLEDGVIGMKLGGKRKLFIPAELAYGSQGHVPVIPPDADLIVEVEVLNITPGQQFPGGAMP